jgi:hypothetical protein
MLEGMKQEEMVEYGIHMLQEVEALAVRPAVAQAEMVHQEIMDAVMEEGVVEAVMLRSAVMEEMAALLVEVVEQAEHLTTPLAALAAQAAEEKSASGQGDDMKTKNDGTKNKQND